MRGMESCRLPAAVALWLLFIAAGPQIALGAAPLDDFLCYATHSKVAISADLVDALDSGAVESKSGARVLCTPADPNNVIADPLTHLIGWRIVGPNAERKNITVQNQFGTFMFDTRPARTLLVPALKSLPPAPPPQFDPNNENSEVDHYHCAFVRISKGTLKFPKGITTPIVDQFGTRTTAVKKPLKLCVPTNKNGEGIKHADRQLMCYRAKPTPRTRVDAAQVSDQFGTETLKLTREAELCVPSTSTLASPSGAFLDGSAGWP